MRAPVVRQPPQVLPKDVRVVEGRVTLAGAVVRQPTALVVRPGTTATVVSCERAVFLAPLHLGPGVSVARCRFGDAVGLDQLRFSTRSFRRANGRWMVRDGSEHTYRSLRRAAERSRLFDVAADFHIGELEARRATSPPVIAALLRCYGLVGGYGHRPLRPFLSWLIWSAFVATMMTTWPDRFVGGGRQIGGAWVDADHWFGVYVKFVLRISIAVFAPIEYGDLHTDAFALLITARIVTVGLFVMTAMGVRSRLRR